MMHYMRSISMTTVFSDAISCVLQQQQQNRKTGTRKAHGRLSLRYQPVLQHFYGSYSLNLTVAVSGGYLAPLR